ncbi:MAG: VOC family protein [Nannocystaceae bacterium]|nr:VOC family protein [Nannocystaceae bacterium]
MAFLELVTIIVDEYDPAIRFYVDALGFDLVEDSPSLTNDGRAKRWVVVRPPGAQTGILTNSASTSAWTTWTGAPRPCVGLPVRHTVRL